MLVVLRDKSFSPFALCPLLSPEEQKTAHVYWERRRQRLQKALPGHNFPDIDGSAQRAKDEGEKDEKKKRNGFLCFKTRSHCCGGMCSDMNG